jgi:hypothetical protein
LESSSRALWRSAYGHSTDGLLFFAEDILGDQFCISSKENSVLRFSAETAGLAFVAESIEKWADVILADYNVETGWSLAHEWQIRNCSLEPGQRLQPKIPFVYGGEYVIENLWAGDAVEGMLFKGEVALKVRDLPDGTQVKLQVGKADS